MSDARETVPADLAEIERLRALVRELRIFLPCPRPEWGDEPEWIVDLKRRMRAELGDQRA